MSTARERLREALGSWCPWRLRCRARRRSLRASLRDENLVFAEM
jgi:hypothetical protein